MDIAGRRVTGTTDVYIDPEREIDADASGVHGLAASDLAGKPTFAETADGFLAFVTNAEVVIHNAP